MVADSARHRLGLIAVCALTLFAALFARLWYLQVVQADAYAQQVTASTTRTVVEPAPRGEIFDRNGVKLVENVESTVVAVDKQQYNRLERDEQAAALAALVKGLNRFRLPKDALTVEDVRTMLDDQRNSEFRPVPIAKGVPMNAEIYFREEAERFPTVVVERRVVRHYPYGQLAAHVLGRVGPITAEYLEAHRDETAKPYSQNDEVGLAGVEQSYESYLRGTPGKRVYEVDSRNRIVRELEGQRVEPVPGDDVYLSIDARIQYKTEEALTAWVLEESTEQAGAATIVDPRNGQVIAMASYPTYDPNALVGGVSTEQWNALNAAPEKRIMNRAMSEGYPAASTFKLATAYAGLKLGLISPYDPVVDQGVLQLCEGEGSGCRKKNSGTGDPMGPIDLPMALTRSSDYYFYLLGVNAWYAHTNEDRWGDSALQDRIKDLGYGERTGIDLPAETAGRVPTPASQKALADALWERSPKNYGNDEDRYHDAQRWKAGYSADVAIGQYDTLVSPLQTANAYASLANPGGVLYQPSIVSKITAKGRPDAYHYVLEREKRVIRTVEYGDTRDALLQGFTGVVSQDLGTAHRVFSGFPLDSFPIAGKTGTAEVGDDDKQKADNSMFVAFGPNPDSRYVVSVLIQGGGFGAAAAAPAARMILEPIADGSIEEFEVPEGGRIDLDAARARTEAYQRGGTD